MEHSLRYNFVLLDVVQNEGCVTVTKVVTDPNNLVDDSIEANLQFLIQIKNGDGTVRNSELYTDGESNTIRLGAGETFTVEESNGPPPNGVTFDQTSEGECTGTIVSERNHNCVITNRITGTDQNAIPIAPEKDLESSPGNISNEVVSSIFAQSSQTSGSGQTLGLTNPPFDQCEGNVLEDTTTIRGAGERGLERCGGESSPYELQMQRRTLRKEPFL